MTPRVRQVILGASAVSLMLGYVVGTAIESDDPSKRHFISLFGTGVTALVVILFGVFLSVTLNPTLLVVLGVILLIGGLGGPSAISHFWPNSTIDVQDRGTFMILAILEFIGGAFLCGGLLHFFRRNRQRDRPN